jgi:hypothetical protein
MARSRRACPERSRGNPGDVCWQVIFRAFRPQTTREIKKSQPLRGAQDDAFLEGTEKHLVGCKKREKIEKVTGSLGDGFVGVVMKNNRDR